MGGRLPTCDCEMDLPAYHPSLPVCHASLCLPALSCLPPWGRQQAENGRQKESLKRMGHLVDLVMPAYYLATGEAWKKRRKRQLGRRGQAGSGDVPLLLSLPLSSCLSPAYAYLSI